MSYDEFVDNVMYLAEHCPEDWRKGQSVFNVVECEYGVARAVQFEDGIDCFYNDNEIDSFLKKAWERINKK